MQSKDVEQTTEPTSPVVKSKQTKEKDEAGKGIRYKIEEYAEKNRKRKALQAAKNKKLKGIRAVVEKPGGEFGSVV
jgi:hypothetical protein